ncbi:glycosyltransferase 87 family protein [Nakamurella antarctica]|uniref:glycosyltransferase 87 family protein n=1 Tax=Nakamurella antarctica TaxID=1902245 RepID=UPI0013DDD81A|nr:glycosyltransferase 87 family protein [Nakamurella antarctica]
MLGKPEADTAARRFVRWLGTNSAAAYAGAALLVLLAAVATYGAGRGLGSPRNQFDLHIYYDAVSYWARGGYLYSYSQPDVLNGSLGFTYPPIAAVLMWPMTLLPWHVVQVLTLVLIITAAVAFVWLCVRDSVRINGATGLVLLGLITCVAFLYEPMRLTLSFGQVNIFLGLFVAFDLLFLQRRGSKWMGIGIGLAVAIKITPGIFIVYLLCTARWRAAIVASATAAVASVVAIIFAQKEVLNFYTEVLWDTSRVGLVDTRGNQSINGLLARLASPEAPSKAVWVLLAGIVVAFGLWRARSAFRAGDEMAGMALAGMAGLMVSPVTWVHHAVWVIPAVIVLAHRLVELRGAPKTREFYSSVALLVVGVGWLVSLDKYVADYAPNWSGAGWWAQLMGNLPILWILAALAFLPARKQIPLLKQFLPA